ncbi:MAG TPA: ATP-binding protein [Planktothrix sp.]|jgi:ATP-dependent DNA helicase RecG
MSLFGKPITEISFEDIENFCAEKHPENVRLDYKEAFSSGSDSAQMAKLACAFANAYGGLVLLGVKEEKQKDGRGIPTAIPGVAEDLKPGERIKQICLDNITPPLIPEVESVPIPDSASVVVVVRVGESDQTPHFMRETGRVYVRLTIFRIWRKMARKHLRPTSSGFD